MSDYRLRLTVRNARLLRAIEAAGHRPGETFAAVAGIDYGKSLLPYLNLTRSPIGRDGLLRECAWSLCDYLGASPGELWSDEQLTPLASNVVQKDLNYEQMRSLSGPVADGDVDPQSLAAQSRAARLLLDSLDDLTHKEAVVIRCRFGIGAHEMTLEEVGDQLGTTRERVRQIEMKALKKLRHPSRNAAALADAFDIAVPPSAAGSTSPTQETHA